MSEARPHHRAEKFDKALAKQKVDPAIRERILAGAYGVGNKDRMAQREWYVRAMRETDGQIDPDTLKKAREACACCVGGKRGALARDIRKQYDTLEARVEALGRESYIVGHSAELVAPDTIRVQFGVVKEGARCPCLPVTDEPMPVSHCQCCGGHIKQHAQMATGAKLDCAVESTILSSCGTKPCVFTLRVIEDCGLR